ADATANQGARSRATGVAGADALALSRQSAPSYTTCAPCGATSEPASNRLAGANMSATVGAGSTFRCALLFFAHFLWGRGKNRGRQLSSRLALLAHHRYDPASLHSGGR